MKDDVIELARLHDEGLKAYQNFERSYDTLIPNRHNFGTSEPEHHQTAKTLAEAKEYTSQWIAKIIPILERSGKTRYKLQFNDPNGRAGLRMPQENTLNEEELGDILDDLELRLGELRKIIIDYEQSFENVARDSNEPVEPASYDPKTRTLLFADKVIRFKKNAPFTPALCDVVFSKPDKLWTLKELQTVWDDLYEYLGNERPTDWHRVYEAFNRLNERIRKFTGIDDLFVFSTKSVCLNKKYLAKKSQ